MEVSGQLHTPASYPQGKIPWYVLDRRLGGPQSRSGRGAEEKNSQPLPGLEPPIIQAVAQHNTAELTRAKVSVVSFANFCTLLVIVSGSRDSSVGIAQGYGLDDRGSRVRFPAGTGNFSLTTAVSRTALGLTQPPIQRVPGDLSLGAKRPGREADHLPPSSTEVKEYVELYLHSPDTFSWRGA
jgi:hypothetical protein